MTTQTESELVRYAREELQRAGLFDKDSDYDGELGPAILAVVETFASFGHSGLSAAITTAALERLLRFQPLTPLTSDPSEWNEVTDDLWQSRRNPAVFSHDGGQTWYDIDETQEEV